MASISAERKNGRCRYRIQFVDGNKKRRSIRLTNANKKTAQAIAGRVETLVACNVAQQPMPTDLTTWIVNLGNELHAKLAHAGLVKPRESSSLGAFIDGYIDGREEAAPNTVRNWNNSRHKLTDFFGDGIELRSISRGNADDWRQWLVNQQFSDATISKAVKHAKQFLRVAVRKGLADANPFQELVAGGEENPERKAFIDHETVAKVIAACPDSEWRLIVALSRFGGLRIPSELLRLEWSHVDWDNGRFTITKGKTKWRTVPLFAELLPFLQEAYELAPRGTRYVISRYRKPNSNLRTQLMRILRRAGVEPWERLFHNMRASRQTELQNQFPSHVVAEWLGNSEAIAFKHYLQVTEDHFAQAQGGAGGGARVVQKLVQQPSEANCNELQQMQKASGVTAIMPVFSEAFETCKAPPRGNALPQQSPVLTAILEMGGATGGASADEMLARLIELWPSLSHETRQKIMEMATAD